MRNRNKETKMKRIFLPGIVCLFLLSGCTRGAAPVPDQSQAINTTLVGILIKTGTTFELQKSDRTMTQLDSYTQKFDAFVGKKISVTGQYSGTTLFVDVVSEVK